MRMKQWSMIQAFWNRMMWVSKTNSFKMFFNKRAQCNEIKSVLCNKTNADENEQERVTRFAWWGQDLHAIELLRAHIGEWTMTWMLDYWWVMYFTGYRLNWNSWIWIPFPVDSDCTLLCTQVDKTRYSSIASGNNCIVQLCKCVSLHL
jgi:hypothetical protein